MAIPQFTLEPNERSRDVYENISAYPKAPLVPLPDLSDPQSYRSFVGKITPFSLFIGRSILRLIGLKRDYPEFTKNIESAMRSANTRLPGLYAPVISASLALADDPRIADPLWRAASLIAGARSLCMDLFSGRLPPDTLKGQPLEMGQYPNLFATGLVIENGQARMYKSTHFEKINLVLGGRYFQLDLGSLEVGASIEQMRQALQRLVETFGPDAIPREENSPGYLTASADRTQFQAFTQIAALPQNRSSLQAIRHSLLTVCLDLDHSPKSAAEATRLAQAGNIGNRWYHSSLQVVIFGNGKACLICNFTCYLDGNVMMRGGAEIQNRGASWPLPIGAEPQAVLAEPIRLEWDIAPELLELANKDIQAVLDDQPATYTIEGFGREFFNERNLQAVPIFTVALEMAARRLTGAMPTIAQFLTMSRYRCTDMTIQKVTTPEVVACVEKLDVTDPDKTQVIPLLQQAIASQSEATQQARNQLTLTDLATTYMLSLPKARRRKAMLFYFLGMVTLKKLGYFEGLRTEILISHPEIYPQIPVIGRPGVRLPYAKLFGLHYQIFNDKTVVTFMPSTTWNIPNQQLAQTINDCAQKILLLIQDAQSS